MPLNFDLALLPSSSVLLPLAAFIFVSSITPGPNNVMLTASGANFGYQRSVPHMLGISVGATLMLLVVGAGLGAVFARWPQLYTLLQWVGAAYLVWLAWKIATAGRVQTGQAKPQPLNFWQAAAFQWVNPKAWLMSVGVVAAWLLGRVLDGLGLGESTADGLGLPLAPLRMALVAVLALATGTAVAQTGLIAFVGLAAPHLVRSVVKTTHGRLIGLASLMGAVLLSAADILARWLIAPQELPVGVLTAVLGGTYLLWLMHRNTGRGNGL